MLDAKTILKTMLVLFVMRCNFYSISANGKVIQSLLQDNDELDTKTNQQSLAQLASMLTTNQYQPTTLPSLMTTNYNSYIESLAQSKQYQQQQIQQTNKQHFNSQNMYYQQQQQNQPQDNLVGESGNNENVVGGGVTGDDTVSVATTVNNHSRNNQPQKPPQYVDVSGLMSQQRDRNLTVIQATGGGFHSGGLVAKSHSGLPECATQQVCNAIFVKMNYTQRLCECSSSYNWKCSSEPDERDGHTIELTRKYDRRIYTQIKTCEPLREVRTCKAPSDWTLLALQSERSGKAHYVVVCKCPIWATLEGPYTHNHPPYANIPGIRVYGMLCAHQTARSSAQTHGSLYTKLGDFPEFPWMEAFNVVNTTNLLSFAAS